MQIYKNPAKLQPPPLSSEQNRAVAVTEETEIMCKCKIIYVLPITLDKGRDQKKEGTLRLMEVGHKDVNHLERITRNDYYTCS
jgi:hypothetical protein